MLFALVDALGEAPEALDNLIVRDVDLADALNAMSACVPLRQTAALHARA